MTQSPHSLSTPFPPPVMEFCRDVSRYFEFLDSVPTWGFRFKSLNNAYSFAVTRRRNSRDYDVFLNCDEFTMVEHPEVVTAMFNTFASLEYFHQGSVSEWLDAMCVASDSIPIGTLRTDVSAPESLAFLNSLYRLMACPACDGQRLCDCLTGRCAMCVRLQGRPDTSAAIKIGRRVYGMIDITMASLAKQLCGDSPTAVNSSASVCPICSLRKEECLSLDCGHVFCIECSLKCDRKTCPLCLTDITGATRLFAAGRDVV